WWNKMGFASPIDHLLKLLDCTDAVRDDTWRVGEGWLWRRVTSPTKFADPAIASPQYLRALIPAVRMAKGDSKWSMPGLFVMRRGPFVIAHVNRERDGEPL